MFQKIQKYFSFVVLLFSFGCSFCLFFVVFFLLFLSSLCLSCKTQKIQKDFLFVSYWVSSVQSVLLFSSYLFFCMFLCCFLETPKNFIVLLFFWCSLRKQQSYFLVRFAFSLEVYFVASLLKLWKYFIFACLYILVCLLREKQKFQKCFCCVSLSSSLPFIF